MVGHKNHLSDPFQGPIYQAAVTKADIHST